MEADPRRPPPDWQAGPMLKSPIKAWAVGLPWLGRRGNLEMVARMYSPFFHKEINLQWSRSFSLLTRATKNAVLP